jgi:hypothetical protein
MKNEHSWMNFIHDDVGDNANINVAMTLIMMAVMMLTNYYGKSSTIIPFNN